MDVIEIEPNIYFGLARSTQYTFGDSSTLVQAPVLGSLLFIISSVSLCKYTAACLFTAGTVIWVVFSLGPL